MNIDFSPRYFLAIIIIIFLGLTVSGLSLIDSPDIVNAKRLDKKRIADLRAIERLIDNHASLEGSLPLSLTLSDIKLGQHTNFLPTTDPSSGVPYGYLITGENSYRLCASFSRDNSEDNLRDGSDLGVWRHPAGEHCFDLELQLEPGSGQVFIH
jgi:hypothetical protein